MNELLKLVWQKQEPDLSLKDALLLHCYLLVIG